MRDTMMRAHAHAHEHAHEHEHARTPDSSDLSAPQPLWVADDDESTLGFLEPGCSAASMYKNSNPREPAHELQCCVNDVTASADDIF